MNNVPTYTIDDFGLDSFEVQISINPDLPGYKPDPDSGTTFWNTFDPEFNIDCIGSCCMLSLSGGSARLYVVYTPGIEYKAEELWMHEKKHVVLHLMPAHKEYVEEVNRILSDINSDFCLSFEKAMCFANVLSDELVDEYIWLSYMNGKVFDYADYGQKSGWKHGYDFWAERVQGNIDTYNKSALKASLAITSCYKCK